MGKALVVWLLGLCSCGGSVALEGAAGGTAGGGTAGGGTAGGDTGNGGAIGGSNPSAATGGDCGGWTAEQFPDMVAAQVCGTLGPCCDTASFTFASTACETNVRTEFQSRLVEIGGGVALDCASSKRCLDELAANLSDCKAIDETLYTDCGRLLIGTLPSRAKCYDMNACADGTCDGLTAGGAGTCTPNGPIVTAGKLGDACVASCTKDACYVLVVQQSVPDQEVACLASDGLFCAADLHCQPIGQAGATCQFVPDCSSDLYCDPATNRCAAPKPIGAPCDYAFQCETDWCHGTCYQAPLATQALCAGMPYPIPFD